MIYKKLTLNDFIDAFKAYDRDYYSYEGYAALYQLLEDCYEGYELDVIAICCDFTEYSLEDLINEYSYAYGEVEATEPSSFLEWLHEQTLVLELDNGNYIIPEF